jgi:hypothetical protein
LTNLLIFNTLTLTAKNQGSKLIQYDEYKVIYVTEGGCGTILLGSSGMPLKRLEATLNQEATDGWQLVFQVIEQKRFWLFWSREAVILTLGRSRA